MSRSTIQRLLTVTSICALLTSCTSPVESPPPEGKGSSSSTTGADTPRPPDEGMDFFTTGTASSVDPWWSSDPSLAPADQQLFSLSSDRKLEGPQVVRSESLAGKVARVVITCSEPVPYSVIFLTGEVGNSVTTSGDSCGGPDINAYDTPVLVDGTNAISVTVPRSTSYFLTIYTRA